MLHEIFISNITVYKHLELYTTKEHSTINVHSIYLIYYLLKNTIHLKCENILKVRLS